MSIIKSSTNAELISQLRLPHTIDIISAEDLAEVAHRLAEFEHSPLPQHVRARKKRASRADRFSEAQGEATDAKSSLEELRDELQNWLDNMPENMQGGDKASQLEEAISTLEEGIQSLEEVEGLSVEFPGMIG